MADHDTSSDSGSSAVTLAASLPSEFHSLPARPVPAPRRRSSASRPSSSARRPGDEVVDRILQQSRSDRMFELRKLQHGERPVTGQGHREKLEQLFAEQQEDAPVTEGRRPEAILVEVHSVAEARPVQAMLQSARFRQQLESVIRSSLTPAPRPLPGASVTPSPLAGLQQRSDSRVSITESSSSGSLSHIGAAAPRPPRAAASERRRRPERLTAVLPRPAPPAPPASAARVPQVETPPRAQRVAGWLESATREAPANADQAVWHNIEEAYREEMIQDISELVHRQLVTSTLDSGFRNTLEGRMLQRLEVSETDGERVARAIRALPRGAVTRNDFSHLGIMTSGPAFPDDVDENVSYVSAQAVPISHTNAGMSREIRSLRSQMAEMKQMLKLTFDLQLDLQRAVRQEVSAALSRLAPETPAESLLPVSRPVSDSQCIICLESEADCVLYRCGHLCLCYTCGMKLQERGNHCPVCRAPIEDIVRAYKTSAQ